jgi:hypothetical protein
MTATMENVLRIVQDLETKLEETKHLSNDSELRRLLLIKKQKLDLYLTNITKEVQVYSGEYQLYVLGEERDLLLKKYREKESRPAEDDIDVIRLKEIKQQMNWIRQTKLDGIPLTNIPTKLSMLRRW